LDVYWNKYGTLFSTELLLLEISKDWKIENFSKQNYMKFKRLEDCQNIKEGVKRKLKHLLLLEK